ncbi:hypothetical protein A3F02_03675 [Candidatus Curtissbacteria bacterium RIFCSPHIGHO2_12_FULL_38_9b]|uniref:Uncharacterized protein n=1 Tax=Candidatus Curtissbacteria bacterium RIFCSPHIGHO2_12_FULL_38_9b TaxID=1797720 RepID=A0A1F5GSS5_9BACT|nr:MAG: hypothetical protein A3F02_03675 [Candidatus Curtissbacteria bacterium RIFCSPHIGHO2_12_FULL_38_9b]
MAKDPTKTKASTQQHLDFDDMTDDLIIFKTGWVALVMTTTAVNFDLLSEAEQDATIYAYGAFLNSLTFPVQILIRSKKADITAYFNSLAEAEKAQPNPDLKRQIQKYEDFIQSVVQQKAVLDKKFYLIINFSPLEMGFRGLGKKNVTQTKSKMQLINDAKAALFPKRDHIIKQMARLGLTTRQLTTKELIELFYDIYNPAPTGTQRVILDTSSYTVPIVEPAVEVPTPAPTSQSAEPGQDDSSIQIPPVLPTTIEESLPATRPFTKPDITEEELRPVAPLSQEKPSETLNMQIPQSPTPLENQPLINTIPNQQPVSAPLPTASSNLSSQQQSALADLQAAAANAAKLINRSQPITTAAEPNQEGG